MLERIRGYALASLGKTEEARGSLNRSLELGRSVGADYEVAQTLLLAARLAERTGDGSVSDLDREADEILKRLGVIRLPEVPLPVVLPH
jgi:hypothetical protein